MIKEEALNKLADIIFYAAKNGYMPYDTNDEMCAMNIAKKHIDDFYTSLPSNIDEIVQKIYPNPDVKRGTSVFANEKWTEVEKLRKAFKDGWMAGQGITVTGDTDDEYKI